MTWLALIFLFANDLFTLLPWELPVPPKDIALGLIAVTLAIHVLFGRSNVAPLENAFTGIFIPYFFLVLLQVALATLNYGQP